jgi:hypothetical protein
MSHHPSLQSTWMLVSEGGLVGSEYLRQMSEYPIPPPGSNSIPASWGNGGLHACILKKRYRDTDLPQGWWAECSQNCFLPPISVLTKPVHLRKPLKFNANENPPNPRLKCPLKPQPLPEQGVTNFWALLQYPGCSLSFLCNKSYFVYWLWLTFSCLTSQFSGLWRQGLSDTSLLHFDTCT